MQIEPVRVRPGLEQKMGQDFMSCPIFYMTCVRGFELSPLPLNPHRKEVSAIVFLQVTGKSQVFIIIFFFILIIKMNWRIMNCFVHFFQIGKDLYYFVYSYSILSLFRSSYINRTSCCTFFFQPTTFNHIQQNRSCSTLFYL